MTSRTTRTRHGMLARGPLIAATVALTIVLVGTGGRAGASYAPADSLIASSTRVRAGDTITATATGYAPGSDVAFTLADRPLGHSEAGQTGTATLTFTVPDLDPGDHELVAVGVASDGSALTTTTILTVLGMDSAPLPATGANIAPLAVAGVVLLVCGGASLALGRLRKRAP